MTDLMTDFDPGELDEFSTGDENPKRPDISDLPDAVVQAPAGPIFLARVGDKIVAEICCDPPSSIWLATRTGTVQEIDTVTGNFMCWDPEKGQHFGGNFKSTSTSTVYKLSVGKMKKRRRKGTVPAVIVQKNTEYSPASSGEEKKKRGRGRPKGSKNRPKEVIAGERAARAAMKKLPRKRK